jgi:hypothetical protein
MSGVSRDTATAGCSVQEAFIHGGGKSGLKEFPKALRAVQNQGPEKHYSIQKWYCG